MHAGIFTQPFAHCYAAKDAHSPVGGDRIPRLLLSFFWNRRSGLELSVVQVLRAYIPAHRQLDTGHRHFSLVMQGVHMRLHHACTVVQRLQYACQSTISSIMLRETCLTALPISKHMELVRWPMLSPSVVLDGVTKHKF